MFSDNIPNRQSVLLEPLSGEGRVTQDDIILQNEQTPSTLQAVICPVCLLILGMPHWVCEGCDNAFCRQCLENWWKKNPNNCIFRCSHPSFKLVKRSNTYQAILGILKARCKYCKEPTPVSSIGAHDSICPRKLVPCLCKGCDRQIAREQLQEHTNICQFRREKCPFCSQLFLIGIIEDHRKECPDRPIVCDNEGCGQTFKASDFDSHRSSCEFFKMECQWCLAMFFRNTFQQHCQNCGKREIQCQWCHLPCLLENREQHNEKCPERSNQCELCQLEVKDAIMKDHRLDCMFKEMLTLKASHYQLSEDNVKLKMRVHELEMELEESIRGQHESTVNSLIKIKEEQRKEHEKDLLRIRNSMASLKKCRTQELAQHQKRLHISTSLCVICAAIRKKLEDEMEPLLRMEEETLIKLRTIQREESATRKSTIRL